MKEEEIMARKQLGNINSRRYRGMVERMIEHVLERLDPQALAFVDACFSDPGLAELRRATDKPVFGIAETAYRRAAANGGRFGVLSIQEGSLARHRRYIGALGLTDYLAGDRLSV